MIIHYFRDNLQMLCHRYHLYCIELGYLGPVDVYLCILILLKRKHWPILFCSNLYQHTLVQYSDTLCGMEYHCRGCSLLPVDHMVSKYSITPDERPPSPTTIPLIRPNFLVTDSGFCSYTNPSRATIPLIRPHQWDSEGGRIRGVLL